MAIPLTDGQPTAAGVMAMVIIPAIVDGAAADGAAIAADVIPAADGEGDSG